MRNYIFIRFILVLFSALLSFSGSTAGEDGRKLSDDELLETVSRQTFRYFWDYAYPSSGMARERSKGGGSRFSLQAFDGSYLSPSGAKKNESGLAAEYFNNMDLTGTPALRRIDKKVDMEWKLAGPDSRVNADRFSVRWTGSLKFPDAGEYEIGLGSDDGARLFFDGKLLIDNWGDHGYEIKTVKVAVKKELSYPVKVEYYENGQEAKVLFGRVKKQDENDKIEEDLDNTACAVGGTGMGVMSVIVGAERGWVTRKEAAERLLKLVRFLEKADRFHGVFPHWMHGETGKTLPFSEKDDGADLVETSFLFQGLLCARAYFKNDNPTEKMLREKITKLWEEVEWNWFTRGENVLYWHWSPKHGFGMAHQLGGYNECLITYILAASAKRNAIRPEVYHNGFARNGGHRNGKEFHGFELPLGMDWGGPLFFAHYSFLGLNPKGLTDRYADYWKQNVNHTMINRAHCINNHLNYKGYGKNCWGLTASDNHQGYSAHSPTNDLGVITPTAALSSMPYTPVESMEALRHFYYGLGDKIRSRFGFVDAFSETHNWYAQSHLAIDQGPIIVMIENHRTGLIWDLFMGIPEIKNGLSRLGFSVQK